MVQPTNLNFLSPLNFRFSIKKTPNVDFFCTNVNIPGITLGESDQESPLVRIPIPGDHISFNELTITFNVDEDMKNYKEMYDWITSLGFPESFSQYPSRSAVATDPDLIYSDCTLSILSSKQNTVARIDFEDAYITSISDLAFSTNESDVVYVSCQASLRYKLYKLTLL